MSKRRRTPRGQASETISPFAAPLASRIEWRRGPTGFPQDEPERVDSQSAARGGPTDEPERDPRGGPDDVAGRRPGDGLSHDQGVPRPGLDRVDRAAR